VVLIAGGVMYSVEIHTNVYRQWQVWFDWCTQESDGGFGDFCMNRYPEVLSMNRQHKAGGTREFVFESKDHYAWFLLQVM
jgi:hypothetical protein